MQRETLRNEYRAGASIHRVLIKGLTNSEGDEGGADTGGRLDGQALSLLGDFHRGAGSCCHCNLPQENVHTCSHTTNTMNVTDVIKGEEQWSECLKPKEPVSHINILP